MEPSDALTAAGYDRATRFDKQLIALRYWLLGSGFVNALAALEFAAGFHTGLRKDGRTPEFAHQVAITHHVRTLVPHLADPETALCAALLHDVREDYDVAFSEIADRFGSAVARSVDALTKEFAGVKRPPEAVFAAIAEDPSASVVKPADRVNNQLTALGVFSTPKLSDYVAETVEWFLPMIRRARRLHPTQEAAYENLKLVLEVQVEALSAVVDLSTVSPAPEGSGS
jgi:(p)ppGpp synthase/HD superfamily hydrolase